MATATKGLGKGLSALMSEDYSQEATAPVSADSVQFLKVSNLVSGVYQPRTQFDESLLKELSDSIKSNGVMQPILARKLSAPRDGAEYEIIAGERRWRASKMAGLATIPVLIKNIEDRQALEMALIENIQRQDLNALEEAEGYQQLMDGFSYTQEELSGVVGKSRSHVANCLRLLVLPQKLKDALVDGEISAGHARALLKCDKPEELVYEVVRRGLNVRQTENLVRAGGVNNGADAQSQKNGAAKPRAAHDNILVPTEDKDPDIIALEETLHKHLNIRVSVNDKGEHGNVVLFYDSLAELDSILKRLGGAF